MMLTLASWCGGCCLPEAIRSTCQPYEAIKERSVVKWRAQSRARRIWAENYEGSYASRPCAEDVRAGFLTAYEETALGMGSCPPPVPSRPLLSRDNILHTYPAASPWYEGYSLGHASAVANGVDQWRLAPLDPQLMLALCQCQQPCQCQGRTNEVEMLPQQPLPESLLPEPIIPESVLPESVLPGPVIEPVPLSVERIEAGMIEDVALADDLPVWLKSPQ